MGSPQARRSVRLVKLLPPVVPPDTIRRPRLLASLDRIGALSASLVIAGPGYGKSTLLAQWARSARRQCVWISLDPGDDDPVIFASILAVAIDRVLPGVMSGVATLLQQAAPDPRALGEAFVDALAALDRHLVVIFDDYHAIAANSAVNDLLDSMLRQPAPNVHVVLAARWRPAIPALDDLEQRGLLDLFDEGALRLSDADALRLLRSALPDGAGEIDFTRTLARLDGWPAGLRMAWLALRQGRRAAGSDPVGLDLSGVFGAFDEADLLALEPAAVLEEVAPSLVAAVTGEDERASGARLSALARRRQFVTSIDADGSWFRLHHLLREALLARLAERVGQDGVAILHARASAWFEAHGDITTAIRHAVLAGDVERAAGLIEAHAYDVADRGVWDGVRVWLRQLPDGYAASRPGLLLLEANLLGEDGLIGPMRETMKQAALLLDQWPDRDEAAAFQLEFDGLACFASIVVTDPADVAGLAYRLLDDPRSSATARSSALAVAGFDRHAQGDTAGALRMLAEAERTSRERDLFWATAAIGPVWAHMFDGAISPALAAARRALALATDDHGYLAPWANCLAGLLAYEVGDLETARACLERADRFGRLAGPWAEFASAAGHALVLRAIGQPDAARARARNLRAALALRGDTPWLQHAAALEARLDLLGGSTAVSEGIIAWPAVIWNGPLGPVENPTLTLGLALLARRAEGDAGMALALARQTRDEAGRRRNRWWLGRAIAIEAMAHDALGERETALALLAEALTETRDGLIRRFADLGPGLAPLLQAAAGGDDPATAHAATEILGLMRATVTPPAAPAAVDPDPVILGLTLRERQVLFLLRDRATNREIAVHLGVSEGTAKKHVANLLRKLNLTSRRAAGELASALGGMGA